MLKYRCILQSYAWHILSLALILVSVGLAGCSDTPHDRVDTTTKPTQATALPATDKTTSGKSETDTDTPPPTEAELGMPVYPQAKTYGGMGGKSVKPSLDNGMTMALLETSDSLDKVLDFYKARIKVTDARGNSTPTTPREEKENDRRKVVLTGNDAQGNTQVASLHTENGKTIIELMRLNVKSLPSSVSGGK